MPNLKKVLRFAEYGLCHFWLALGEGVTNHQPSNLIA